MSCLLAKVFRRQRRAEAAIDIAAQYLQRLPPGLVVQLAVGRPSSQSMHEGRVAPGIQLLQQSTNVPLALVEFRGGLPLRDQSLPCFFQCDQPVAILLRHEKYS
jgi:hypothetical protein